MGWRGWENGIKGGMGDSSPGIALVFKPNPGFLDENNVGCFVCDVEEGVDNVCRFYCIVLDKANSLVGAV